MVRSLDMLRVRYYIYYLFIYTYLSLYIDQRYTCGYGLPLSERSVIGLVIYNMLLHICAISCVKLEKKSGKAPLEQLIETVKKDLMYNLSRHFKENL